MGQNEEGEEPALAAKAEEEMEQEEVKQEVEEEALPSIFSGDFLAPAAEDRAGLWP